MLKSIQCSVVKIATFALLVVSILAVNAPKVQAFSLPDNDNAATGAAMNNNAADAKATEKSAGILYTPFTNVSFEAEKVSTAPAVVFDKAVRVSLNTPAPGSNNLPAPVPPSDRVLRKIPMTSGEKFKYFFKSSFLSVGAYGNAIFSGIRGEALDKDHDPQGVKGNFFGDAGTRAVRSFTFGATSKFFERFLLASIFRQDPRYLRSGKKGFGAKVSYAISRVFITEGDHGGSQFNISYLGGGVGAAFLGRLYDRDERHSISHVMGKWGTHVALTAMTNIIREFVSGQ